MFRYADPTVCPGCRSGLEYGATQCPTCELRLAGPLGQRLFNTLTHADALVAQMRATVEAPPRVLVGVAAPAPEPAPVPFFQSTLPPRTSGMSAASVPKILLGLGATCLLVAALVFLAVAWAALGVGGRTAVLVLLTVVAGGLGAWMAGKDLRAGAESFTAVALGLVALDLGGADAAGWLGSPSLSHYLLLQGGLVGATAAAAALGARRTPVRDLVSAQVVAAIGGITACIGLSLDTSLATNPRLVVAMLVSAGLAVAALRTRLAVTAGGLVGATVIWWILVVSAGLIDLPGSPSFQRLWQYGDAAMLLVAALAAGLTAFATFLPRPARIAAAAAAVAVGTFSIVVVAVDESATTQALTELAVVALAAFLGARLALPWRWTVVVPAAAAGMALGVAAFRLGATALESVLVFEPWGERLTAPLDVPDLAWSWPLLLPAAGLGVLAALWLAGSCLEAVDGRTVAHWAVPVTLVSVAAVPALYGVPWWVELLVLAASAIASAAAAAYLSRVEPLVATVVLSGLALIASFANPWTTAVVLGTATLVSGVAAFQRRDEVALVGGVCVAFAGAGFVWTVEHLAHVDQEWRALPIVLLLGLFTLVKPGVDREVPAYVAGTIAVALSVADGYGVDQSWLAVYLTVGGVVLTTSSLIHPSRRVLAWGGLALFTCAQWIRLQQLGVDTVEAYTLPLAAVLLTVGLVKLATSDIPSMQALSAGLGLALVPTLLQVLVDPVSARALALGTACLVLVLVGVALRWSAPLLAGASVGLLVVLREVAAAQVLSQWMVIGLIGVVLTVVGVTWERRLAELRAAAGYVRSLR